MPLETVEILHINALLSTVQNMQFGTEPSNDAQLGFQMSGVKDNLGVVHKFLEKGRNADILALMLSGATTTGSDGLLKHDTDGNVTGGINSVSELEDVVGAIGGGVTGAGTLNTLAMFTDTDEIGDSTITKDAVEDVYYIDGQTASHTLTSGLVLYQLEVNGASYFDAQATFEQDVYLNDHALLATDKRFYFGGGTNTMVGFSSDQTPSALTIAVENTSYAMVLMCRDDWFTDCVPSGLIDPTLIVKATGAVAAESTLISHGRIHPLDGNLAIRFESGGNLDVGINDSNSINPSAQYNYLFGDGIDITNAARGNLIVGDDHLLDSPYSEYNLIGGDGHQIGYGFNVISGKDCTVDGKYGEMSGSDNATTFDYTKVRGKQAVAEWAHGEFFSCLGALDGGSAGDAQCFKGSMVCRHTESTDSVRLNHTGSGTTLPFVCPDGYQLSFVANIHASYEAAGDGWLNALKLYTVSNTTAGGFTFNVVDVVTPQSGGTNGFQLDTIASDPSDEFAIKITPDNAGAANIVAHIFGGTKIKTEQAV